MIEYKRLYICVFMNNIYVGATEDDCFCLKVVRYDCGSDL